MPVIPPLNHWTTEPLGICQVPRYFLHLDSNGPHNWNIFAKNVTTQRAESALISSSLFSQDNASGMYVYAKKYI